MPHLYSLDSLAQFSQEEAEHLDKLGLNDMKEAPSESCVQNILNYSKQLSVRSSDVLGRYEQNLN
jgi:demethoxyubiquinone hydroxylase (CLK1/Coq7/Cat5 family)